mmetsp:Transcript_27210/g.45515  ORF Transcript_27210/g.45515 Transcript_27210/m.45515 type:complete len:80 (-) Transcript_27210:667-906(-)
MYSFRTCEGCERAPNAQDGADRLSDDTCGPIIRAEFLPDWYDVEGRCDECKQKYNPNPGVPFCTIAGHLVSSPNMYTPF